MRDEGGAKASYVWSVAQMPVQARPEETCEAFEGDVESEQPPKGTEIDSKDEALKDNPAA